MKQFASTAPFILWRSYCRKIGDQRETYNQMVDRVSGSIATIGRYTPEQHRDLKESMMNATVFPSGRALWFSGTDSSSEPENYYGFFNCNSNRIQSLQTFSHMMNFAMLGCGTGAYILDEDLTGLPVIDTKINVVRLSSIGEIGTQYPSSQEFTKLNSTGIGSFSLIVGDSRQGWTQSIHDLLMLATSGVGVVDLVIDLSHIRPKGTPLQRFGGVANPNTLPSMYRKIVEVINIGYDEPWNSRIVVDLIDIPAMAVVSGNIRRSAGMRQAHSNDHQFSTLKDDLWKCDNQGKWSIDPDRDHYRMANHTRVFHKKPTLEECIAAITKQYNSGEGALMYAPEAIARSNWDLLGNGISHHRFIRFYESDPILAKEFLKTLCPEMTEEELDHRMHRAGLNPCGEILGQNFFCNLSEVHLINLDPHDFGSQLKAFEVATLAVCSLLNQGFVDEPYQRSRELDPIVGVSFTGLFDFFVHAFGRPWLEWWEAGRPWGWDGQCDRDSLNRIYQKLLLGLNAEEEPSHKNSTAGQLFHKIESMYFVLWRKQVAETMYRYCTKHDLKIPNRYTCVQPAGSKSLITGSSPGWHPPKAASYIRRMTFAANDPVALMGMAMGYSVIPSQSCKDENGRLLDDPYDPRVTEWLLEIPVKMPWADQAEGISINEFTALAQYDFYMNVQRFWTTHNTSATIEFNEPEIEGIARRMYEDIQENKGYISATFLARSNAPFPRMPFEPRPLAEINNFLSQIADISLEHAHYLLSRFDGDSGTQPEGPDQCDSLGCSVNPI